MRFVDHENKSGRIKDDYLECAILRYTDEFGVADVKNVIAVNVLHTEIGKLPHGRGSKAVNCVN
jgi:hypothetical protein